MAQWGRMLAVAAWCLIGGVGCVSNAAPGRGRPSGDYWEPATITNADLVSVSLGSGYNFRNGAVLGSDCVELVEQQGAAVPSAAAGAEPSRGEGCAQGDALRHSLTLKRVSTLETLAAELGIAAEARYSAPVFSASATAAYYRGNRFATDTFVVLVQGVEVARQATARVRLKPQFAAMARTNPGRFIRTCGYGVVTSIDYGATFRGVLRFENTTRWSRQQISTTLGVAGKTVTGKAEFHQALEQLSSIHSFEAFVDQVGGRTPDQVDLDPAAFVERAEEFACAALGGSQVALTFRVLPYDAIEGFPEDASLPPRPDTDSLRVLLSRRDRLRTQAADVEALLDRAQISKKGCRDAKRQLENAEDKITSSLVSLTSAIRSCYEAGGSCERPRMAELPSVSLPPVCRPDCTIGEADEYGFCTRCRLRFDGLVHVGDHVTTGTQCSYMRGGEPLRVYSTSEASSPNTESPVQLVGRMGGESCKDTHIVVRLAGDAEILKTNGGNGGAYEFLRNPSLITPTEFDQGPATVKALVRPTRRDFELKFLVAECKRDNCEKDRRGSEICGVLGTLEVCEEGQGCPQ